MIYHHAITPSADNFSRSIFWRLNLALRFHHRSLYFAKIPQNIWANKAKFRGPQYLCQFFFLRKSSQNCLLKLDSFFYSHLQCRLRGSLPLPFGFPRLRAQLGIWWLGSVATKTSGKWRRWVPKITEFKKVNSKKWKKLIFRAKNQEITKNLERWNWIFASKNYGYFCAKNSVWICTLR